MTDIMIHDITNPPLAARFFGYSFLSGYEIISQNDTAFKTMFGKLNDYPIIKKPDSINGYSYQLAALLSVMETAKKMLPSGKILSSYQQHFLDSCKQIGYSDATIQNSLRYASAISKQILAYAATDGYNKISNYPRYSPVKGDGYWFPTPPAYMAAVEPWFKTVRSFTMDSSAQFKPAAPEVFSTDKNSVFFKMLDSLYQEGINNNHNHKAIAAFWDCNPFAVKDNGHLLVGLKKISPGAHWMGIAGTAAVKAKKNFNESMQVSVLVAMGLMDGFIACWDEKYRSNRIRPETAIRQYIDPNWKPLLQTPPFPEYLSGHSVISGASAQILTHLFGENFSFIDSVEVSYGLPPREFSSFHQAAIEAGISRFYGGIHFRDAIDNGREQGIKVGENLIRRVLER